MNLSPRWFYFISGLLYPGALGASLNWLVQGATALFTNSDKQPSPWAISFALWFAVYHSLLFVRLMDKHSRWAPEPTNDKYEKQAYTLRALVSDIIDSVALFAVFVILDFLTINPSPNQMTCVYLVSLGVPLSAVCAKKINWKTIRGDLIVLITLTALSGVWINYDRSRLGTLLSWDYNTWLLAINWALLIVYIFVYYRKES